MQCDAVDSPNQIVITCNKQSTTPVVVPPPIITPPVSSVKDPGMFTGTWIPAGMTNVWVVDQSEPLGAGGTTAIPGCANQKVQVNGCTNQLVETKNGVTTTVTLAMGNTMSVRYLSEGSIATNSYFRLAGGDGGGIPAAAQFSISQTPGDFTGASACNRTVPTGQQDLIIMGSANCNLLPNTYYYLNVKTTTTCSGPTCRFKITEPAGLTN